MTDFSKQSTLPHLAYDSVIFGFSGKKLKILVMEYRHTGLFALPGGFVKQDENLNDAVRRGLKERTGLDKIYLEQFYTFGDVERFQPEVMRMILTASGFDLEQYAWMMERFVSVAYYALIDPRLVRPTPDELADSLKWMDVDDLPPLILDHSNIIQKALDTLRNNAGRKLIGMNLLPRQFTMKELQQVFEAIEGKELRRTTFQRKMLASGLLVRHDKLFSGESHKAPYLYSFIRDEDQ